VALRLNDIGVLFEITNRAEQAEPLYRCAVAIYETGYGSDHPHTRTMRNNLERLLANFAARRANSVAAAPSSDQASVSPTSQRGWLARLLGRG
jgi:hypothetical protein